jgi:hypothetical protein
VHAQTTTEILTVERRDLTGERISVIAGAVASAVVFGAAWAVSTAQEPRAGIVTALAGQAEIYHASLPDSAPLALRDDVYVRDRIQTHEESVVRLLLGGKAAVTVRELSVLTITEDPNQSQVELHSGKVALKINKALMRPGDVVEIYTPNAIIGVRGSLVVVEVEGPVDAPQSHVTAVEASLPILVAPRADPARTTALNPNEAVTVAGPRHAAKAGPVRRVAPDQARRAVGMAALPPHARHITEGEVIHRERAEAAPHVARPMWGHRPRMR